MKTFCIDGINLSYSEINGHCSKTILFLNGNSHSRRCFSKQLEDQRFLDYKLISVDLPGHGDSAHLEDYSLITLANIIQKFIADIEIKEFIVVGHSLGGHVAIQLLNFIQPNGLVVFGTPPMTKPFTPIGFLENKNIAPLGLETSDLKTLEALSDELRYSNEDRKIFVEDYYKTDSKFRTQIFQSVFEGKYQDEIKLLDSYTGKIMSILLSDDKIVNNNYIAEIFQLNNADVTTLNSGHSPQIEVADQFNDLLFTFSESLFNIDNYKVKNVDIGQNNFLS